MSDETTEVTAPEAKTEKPRGACTGCRFEYTLVKASRKDAVPTVVRNHNSRVGPGKCEGALKLPRGVETEDVQETETATTAGAVITLPSMDTLGPVFVAAFESDGSCGHDIEIGDDLRSDGEGGYLCRDCSGDTDAEEATAAWSPQHEPFADPAPVQAEPSPLLPMPAAEAGDPGTVAAGWTVPYEGHRSLNTLAPQFADPAPMPAEMGSVSGQPEPDRDRWKRYLIQGTSYTRATTFAKLGSSTYALGEWNERMLIKGLCERPDLLAMAHGLDVKRDSKRLNAIADDAQQHAGNKVAANIGTAYHAFTERLDAGIITLDQIPAQWRERCAQYVRTMASHGLTTRREWIERSTAVRADQVSAPVPVAGTLDRILQVPSGLHVIGDLKTSSNIHYGWAEIAVQLAIYAHGVNTHGLFDWNTKTWQPAPAVSTEYAIVMHLPADWDGAGPGCVLYRVDLVKGWEYAQVSGRVQSRQKDGHVAFPLEPADIGLTQPLAVAAPVSGTVVDVARRGPHMTQALRLVSETQDPAALQVLYEFAVVSGVFSEAELTELRTACAARWTDLNPSY